MGSGRLLVVLGYWLPPLLYCALIFYLSSQPAPELPQVRGIDKGIHVLEYGLLGLMVALALRRTTRMKAGAIMGLACLWTALYGVSDEVHQYFVPNRFADIWDAVADAAGGAVAAGAYLKMVKA